MIKWKNIPKKLMKIALGIVLCSMFTCLNVAAEENQGQVPGPVSSPVYSETSAPGIQLYSGESPYLPTLKSGHYVNWVDRVDLPDYAKSFYNSLVEASDNDGNYDFLIYTDSGDPVKSFEIWEDDYTRTSAKGVKVASVSGTGYSEQAALTAINEQYYQVYYNLRSAFEAFDRDHPEVFWLTSGCYVVVPYYTYNWEQVDNYREKWTYEGDVYFVLDCPYFSVKCDKYDNPNTIKTTINEVNTQVNTILSQVQGMEDYDKLEYFNEWLTMHNEYNYRILYGEDVMSVAEDYPDAFKCTAALKGLTGNYGPVCESYARALKVLCDRSDIQCVLVDGYALVSPDGEGESHMWNYVEVDGAWYAMDVTWNDPVSGNAGAVSGTEDQEYFLLGAYDQTNIGGTMMNFIQSHPVSNRLFSDGHSYINGPELSATRYIKTMESLTLTATSYTVDWGYNACPVITAKVVKASGQTADPIYSWYEVDAYGNETLIQEGYSDTYIFPAGKDPMTYTYRVKATLGNCIKTEDIQIKVRGANFVDVKKDMYFYMPVMWAVLEEVTDGVSETHFGSEVQCTRGQMVTFMWRAAGKPQCNVENPFDDIKEGDYYYEAVLWAVENGITDGISDNQFGPNQGCTRGQVVTFLWRLQGNPKPNGEHPFVDIAEDSYYANAVCWAYENEITSGTDDTHFSPSGQCLRCQIVTFLYRFFIRYDDGSYYDPAYEKLISQELYPALGAAGKSFDPWADMDWENSFWTVDEAEMGLVGALEYDVNGDWVSELLVFYLKQEEDFQKEGIITQKLYMDLYTQENDQAVFVTTIDVLEPFYPWSCLFIGTDNIDMWINTFNGRTWLIAERSSFNEGTSGNQYYVYDITDLGTVEKWVYTDSVGVDERYIIRTDEEGDLYYYGEDSDGEPLDLGLGMICESFEEAEQLIRSELFMKGYRYDKQRVISWDFETSVYAANIDIYDNTLLHLFVTSEN